MIKRLRMISARERGQSFTELAISLVFLLMLFSAAVDLGWAFYTMISLRDTVQEAASFGIMCTDPAKVKTRFYQSALAPIDTRLISKIDVCYTTPGYTSCKNSGVIRGDDVTITVTYMHHIVTPFVGAIINTQDYPLTVSVSDTVMQVDPTLVKACQ